MFFLESRRLYGLDFSDKRFWVRFLEATELFPWPVVFSGVEEGNRLIILITRAENC